MVPVIVLCIVVILVDQWTKFYIQTKMSLGESIPVVDKFFHITYILNSGAAFGILKNQTVFCVIVAFVMAVALLYFYPRIPVGCRVLRWGIGLMIGGAIGNVIDRVKTGQVVDFFDFRIWPVFNVADVAIVTGVSLIMFHILYLHKDKKDEAVD